MAVSMYTRVRLDTRPLKMYGFKKVSPEEIEDINDRVAKPTYNREVYLSDRHRSAPMRAPSARCKKSTDVSVQQTRGGKKLPAPLVDRIVKRMRTPTVSLLASYGEIEPSYEVMVFNEKPRPKSAAQEQKDNKQNYSRPTTASKGKRFCRFCTDPALKEYMEIDYSDDKAVEDEELSAIVKRVSTPTMASRMAASSSNPQPPTSILHCPRRKSIAKDSDSKDKRNTPLACGLRRTRSVQEITHRLYTTPTQVIPTAASAKKDRRQKLAATPITK